MEKEYSHAGHYELMRLFGIEMLIVSAGNEVTNHRASSKDSVRVLMGKDNKKK